MPAIDLDALGRSPVSHDPFDHLVVPEFVPADAFEAVSRDFPAVGQPGSVPLRGLDSGPAFRELLAGLEAPETARIFGEKFGIDLTGRPGMVTVRERCRARDGRIHTDSRDKLVTVLIYLNRDWRDSGGRLRLLRGPDDIEDYAAEVAPGPGTLLAFRCAPDAWHGHLPFEGERRTLQFNWVSGAGYIRRERLRHSVSSIAKRLGVAS